MDSTPSDHGFFDPERRDPCPLGPAYPARWLTVASVALAALNTASCGDNADGNRPDAADSDVEGDGGADVQRDVPDDVVTGDTADVEPTTWEIEDLYSPGQFGIGYRETETTYARPDEGERTIRIALWYPTNDTEGDGVSYLDFLQRPNVWEDATPTGDAGRPVLVYSHGNYGYAEASAFLVEHFASHGWVVVAPDHVGNTIGDLGTPRDTAIYHLRAADLSATLDWLQALPDDDPISQMQTDRIIAAGHSFGGYTVMTVVGATFSEERLQGCVDDPEAGGVFCSTFDDAQRAVLEAGVRDDRILAGITMAAGNLSELGTDGVGAIATPLLQLTGGRDVDVTNESQGDPIWAALPPEDSVRVDLPNGCHQTFAIGCGLPDELDSNRGFEIVNAFALAFARLWAEGDESMRPVLDGTLPVDEREAVVSTH